MKKRCVDVLSLVARAMVTAAVGMVVIGPSNAEAIPAWSRKYQTGCTTCHTVFPKLNYFGRAFRNNGYRFPGGLEQEATKVPPVVMGAEGYKKLFPHAVWPSHIPGGVPVAIRGVSRFNWFEDNQTTTFEFPHEFELLTGGTLGDTFSFFGELEVENANNENELGMAISLQYDPQAWLHVRMGSVAPHPFSDALRLTAAHYSVYDTRTTPGSLTLRARNPNQSTATLSIPATTGDARWRYRDDQAGVEVWGARNGRGGKGGVTWGVGLANGQGVIDSNDHKDVFARVAYKFGGYGELGGSDLPQDLEFWRDDSVKVGAFAYNGKSTNTYEGSTVALSGTPGTGLATVGVDSSIDNDFHIVGVDFDWWFKDLNLFGLYLRQADDNPRGSGESIDTDAWFAEANYTIYPWLVGILRYAETAQDFSVRPDPTKQQFLVPALTFLTRANIKFTIESQMRLDDPGKGHDRYLVGIDFGF
ncbi:MAG: hypothetical protein HY824_15340 [Acidobacteria bacterium]|nr:hypothetical protein [Acidobacteriota bacterium]